VFAVVVWNVVFDHVLVEAGRAYIIAAVTAARSGRPYELIDAWMRPARSRALWWATGSALGILVVGLAAVRRAARATEVGSAGHQIDSPSRTD
jgi:hypothetical protein